VLQFLGETGITTFLALVGAIIIALVCLPFLNNLLEIHLATNIFYSTEFFHVHAGCFIGGNISFQDFILHWFCQDFKSVNVLKSTTNANGKKGISMRRGLVVFSILYRTDTYYRHIGGGFLK
jgi:hypothetical protein